MLQGGPVHQDARGALVLQLLRAAERPARAGRLQELPEKGVQRWVSCWICVFTFTSFMSFFSTQCGLKTVKTVKIGVY